MRRVARRARRVGGVGEAGRGRSTRAPAQRALDPTGDPEHARRLARGLVDIGATVLNLRFVSHSLAHYREQLEAMRGLGSAL